jgi:peptidoglycan/xylan/chitin deacetylase (PgdA/CDA1 family)
MSARGLERSRGPFIGLNAQRLGKAMAARRRRWFSAEMTRVRAGPRARAVVVLAGLLLVGIVLAVTASGGEAPIMPGGAGVDRRAGPSTKVSLTFDDGRGDQYANALPALRAHGFHGTFYVNSARLGGNPLYMTWAQLHAVADAGNEIGGHTLDHPKLTLLGSADVVREICNDRYNLIRQGFQPTDFAYPYGAYSVNIESIVKGCGYNSARAVGGLLSRFDQRCTSCATAERIPPPDAYAIRNPDSVMSTTTVSDLKTLVTQARANGGGWVPIVFHDVCENACTLYSISPANFKTFLDWVRHQVASRAVSVETVQQVLNGSGGRH